MEIEEYVANVAYTKEGIDDYLDTIRIFYQHYKLHKITIIKNEDLFYQAQMDYQEDFPFEISVEEWQSPIGWPFSRLVVKYKELDYKEEMIDKEISIERNYGSSYLSLMKQNNTYFLVFGHDYQGIAALNLTTKLASYYLPKAALEGTGFCITDILSWDESDGLLEVEGCYWAWPYTTRLYKIDDLNNISLTKLLVDGYDVEEDENDNENI